MLNYIDNLDLKKNDFSTREVYGKSLVELYKKYANLVVLDAETGNSTFALDFAKVYPDRYIECYIAEQNMINIALGLSSRGLIPFASTFAAFLTRTFDQIRMSAYSKGHINIIGSHCGTSIGYDGVSQMGLEDLAMFRSIWDSVIFYPTDHISTYKLLELMINRKGINYLRITRDKTPTIYDENSQFFVGKWNNLTNLKKVDVTLISAGITLFEGIKAYKYFQQKDINLEIIDAYCIKPLDFEMLKSIDKKSKIVIVIEDHYPQGGLFEAIMATNIITKKIYSLAVNKLPRSGSKEELLRYEEIDTKAIIDLINSVIL